MRGFGRFMGKVSTLKDVGDIICCKVYDKLGGDYAFKDIRVGR